MSCRFLRRLLALGCLSLCLCTVGVAEDRAAKAKREALEYLEVLAQPRVGLHALEKFESRLEVYPELAYLVNDDVRRARAHKQRWEAHLQEIRSRRSVMRVSFNPEEPDLDLAPGDLSVALESGELRARSSDGTLRWSLPWPEKEVKVLNYSERIVAIGQEKILFLAPKDGSVVHTWPVSLKLDVMSEPWSLFDYPNLILGADASHVFLNIGSWFCVLRQKDADGWAYFFTCKMRAKISADGTQLIIQNHSGSIRSFRLRDGELLWTHYYRAGGGGTELLDVGTKEILFYVPTVGRLVTISSEDGRFLSELNHFDF